MSKVKLYWRNKSVLNISGERWYPVIGYEKLYKLSNYARIKSLMDQFGRQRMLILSQFVDRDGYLRVNLCDENFTKSKGVHRLVAAVFHPNPNNKPQVNHDDLNKKNNLPYNLGWMTNKENQEHARRMGVVMGNIILNKRQVLDIVKSKEKVSVLCKKYNMNYTTIYGIKNGKMWSKLTGVKYKKAVRKSISVVDILRIYKSKLPGIVVAQNYNISPCMVSCIRTGRTYSGVTGCKMIN